VLPPVRSIESDFGGLSVGCLFRRAFYGPPVFRFLSSRWLPGVQSQL